jgi:hypothetical protein
MIPATAITDSSETRINTRLALLSNTLLRCDKLINMKGRYAGY